VSSAPRHRRTRKIRRIGQHPAPSQTAKVVQHAGKAAPAVAVAGTLAAAAPQMHQSVPVKPATAAGPVARAQPDAVVLPAHRPGRSYTVRPGDTLSRIAQRFYGQTSA
jgi:nucleoid-associated protein YgaU